jgi:hypothetical protein
MPPHFLRILIAAAALGLCAAAEPQSTPRQKEILVSLDVGYNTAFREKTWVPVTVDIVNEQRDFNGSIEVRTYDFSNKRQSPSYRLPAQCPQNSRKRFTLYAYLDGAERVEVWLFERGRRAIDAPAYMQVRPIEPDDLLVLVLDDDPFSYGFLYAAVQREGKVVRVSRHGLPTSDLDRLPDIPQAYEAFDAVIFGDIDPGRVSLRHRGLISDYVERGGTLVVSTGKNAADYRGSWLEPLLGAEIGQTALLTEAELARSIPESLREGVRPDRQVVFAELDPVPGVQSVGGGRTLATRARHGRGAVVTLAVDASGRALQDVGGYHALWRDILAPRRAGPPPLNYDAFSNALVQSLPSLSGIKVRPLSWVMTYLLLYLGVGIVANWLFWNLFKRREMAWLCLIVFSIGFTAYAMLFGRSGNLREAQQQTVGVVHVRPGEMRGKVSTLTGILTARTRTYSGALEGERTVVRDAAIQSTVPMNPFSGMRRTMIDSRPFAWQQDEPGHVASFRVGASELRLMRVDGEEPVAGGFEGAIEIGPDGVHGTLQNLTGYEFTEAALVYRGLFLPMTVRGAELVIPMSRSEYERNRTQSQVDGGQLQQLQYLAFRGRMQESEMRSAVQKTLFVDENFQFNYGFPAHVVAWSSRAPSVGFRPDQTMAETGAQTLVVSEVNVLDADVGVRDVFLPVRLESAGGWLRSAHAPPMYYGDVESVSLPGDFQVQISDRDTSSNEGEVVIELYWEFEHESNRAILSPTPNLKTATPEDYEWHAAHSAGDQKTPYQSVSHRTTYRVPEWKDYVASEDPWIVSFSVLAWREQPETADERRFREANIQTWGQYSASARFVPAQTAAEAPGEWPQWQ